MLESSQLMKLVDTWVENLIANSIERFEALTSNSMGWLRRAGVLRRIVQTS